jgi:peptide/nickel transport system permease protein
MSAYFAKRVGWAGLTIAFVVVLNFFLFRILPGDPARMVKDPRLTAEVVAAIQARFGLDKPLHTQFWLYVVNLARGDLGISFHTQRPVADVLAENLWNTLLLIGAGTILSIVLGVALGVIAAWRAGSVVDYTVLVASLVAWAAPTFWLGIILLFWGASHLGLPVGGKLTPGTVYSSLWEQWTDVARHLLLPTLTYTIVYTGQYTLFMRSAILEIFSEDFILTAKAKGLAAFEILYAHALRNAMLPTVTVVALNLGFTVAGAIEIETVFSWPGLGQAVVEAVDRQDYPVLQGAFLLLAVSVIVANLMADLLYSYLDPRIRVR